MTMAGHITDSDKIVIRKTASTLQPSILLSAVTNNFSTHNFKAKLITVGQDRSVGTATRYELDGPGIKSRWGRHFQRPCRPAQGPIQPPTQWVPGLFPGLKRGVDRPPHLARRLKKGRAICLLPSGPSWPVIEWKLPLKLITNVSNKKHSTSAVQSIHTNAILTSRVP